MMHTNPTPESAPTAELNQNAQPDQTDQPSNAAQHTQAAQPSASSRGHTSHPAVFHKLAAADAITEISTTCDLAFQNDPVWGAVLRPSPAFAGVSRTYWELFVRSARRYPWSFSNENHTAFTIWFPPGSTELTPAEEAGFPEFIAGLYGHAYVNRLLTTFERFEQAQPAGDYFYLSLFGVHPDLQGKGVGKRLLAHNLQEIDALGFPTYLESSNPTNDKFYERHGYQRHGAIELPSGLKISTFWRDPHPPVIFPIYQLQ